MLCVVFLRLFASVCLSCVKHPGESGDACLHGQSKAYGIEALGHLIRHLLCVLMPLVYHNVCYITSCSDTFQIDAALCLLGVVSG